MKDNDQKDKKIISQKLIDKLHSTDNKTYSSPKTFRLPLFHFTRRCWHILFSLPLIMFSLFINLFLLIRYAVTTKPVFTVKEFYGKKGKLIKIRYFNCNRFTNLALFYHILSGKLSLTGYSLNQQRSLGDAFIYDYAPGLINLWYIRSASRTAYEGIKNTDREFVHDQLLKAELNPGIKSFLALFKAEISLTIRFLIAKLFNSFKKVKFSSKMFDPIFLFNTRLRNISMNQTLTDIKTTIEARNKHQHLAQKRKIYFVNPDCFNKTYQNSFADYRHILRNISENDWIFADGIGINIAADMLGYPKNENVNGTDLLPRLAELAEKKQYSIFLLGARPGVAEAMKNNLIKQFPKINIAGVQHGYFDRKTESKAVVDKINSHKPDILLVAFGVPFQERWIENWFNDLDINLVIGVGGLFDFYSGRIKRAPRWLRDIGLEWTFRLLMEPRRMFNRYVIGNPLFLHRVKAIQKAASKINKNIAYALKKSDYGLIIEPDKDKFLLQRHAELLDIFPLMIQHCSKQAIKVCFWWNDETAAGRIAELMNQVYPQTEFFADLNNEDNSFYLIVTDKDHNQINSLSKSKDFRAVFIRDERFVKEFSTCKILH